MTLIFLTLVATVASITGAVFAAWRWDYARRAYKLQELQLKLQGIMLDESREYWMTPKMEYVSKKREE